MGDRRFRARSLARLRELQSTASAIIMVTHNLGEIQSTCTRAIWMADGLVRADGEVTEVIAGYEASDTGNGAARSRRRRRRADRR